MSDVTSMNNHPFVCQNLFGMDVSYVLIMILNCHMELVNSHSPEWARIAHGSFHLVNHGCSVIDF
jgi:hypothetical protein